MPEEHNCRENMEWFPENSSSGNPVPGNCKICDAEQEHYCDEYFLVDFDQDDFNIVGYSRMDEPIYGIEYDCRHCGRTLETRWKKMGTWNKDTDEKIYGP